MYSSASPRNDAARSPPRIPVDLAAPLLRNRAAVVVGADLRTDMRSLLMQTRTLEPSATTPSSLRTPERINPRRAQPARPAARSRLCALCPTTRSRQDVEAEKARDKRRCGAMEYFARRADGLDLAAVHHDDGFGQRKGFGLVVRHIDRREAEPVLQNLAVPAAPARATAHRGSTSARRTGRAGARASARGREQRAAAGRR